MYKEITNYLSEKNYPFHMPGHKGRADFFPPDPHLLDVTELPRTDILAAPSGIIKNFQEKTAKFFGAEESFFLVNGSSAGIIAALCAVSDRPIFAARNCHVSFYNGLVFSGAVPNYFLPEITSDGLAGGISPQTFDNLPHGAAVFIVSPTYEGFVSDIATIAKKIHERDAILIVDEAHGAHFPFHEKFPKSALSCGADIVVNSLHKTLPAISGCALLHVNSARVDISRLRFFINAVQTTSPSFMLMTSCDFMLEKLWREPDLFENYVTRLTNFRKEASLSCRERINHNAIFDTDIGKLLFHINGDAEKISKIFAKKYKLQFEMAKGEHLLAMTSVADTDEGFARLSSAIKAISENHMSHTVFAEKSTGHSNAAPSYTLPEIILSPREAMLAPAETVPPEKAVGRIAAELIADYPPGIAKIAPGEIIRERLKKPFVRVLKK